MKKIISLIVLLVVATYSFAKETNAIALSLYNIPHNKQGIADHHASLLNNKRYNVLKKDLQVDLKKFSYYWKDAEDALMSSSTPLTCPEKYILFPKNKDQKDKLNIHNYHCYKKKFVRKWDKVFNYNKQKDMIIAVGTWTSPEFYRDPECEGFYFPLQKRYLMGGCYPALTHYDDYEDWMRFTAHRFGKYIDHYIVWNEIDSTNWADTSTSLYSKKEMITDLKYHMKRSFDIYTELLKKTISAVEDLDQRCMNVQGNCKNLVYVSLTGDWYSRIPSFWKNKKGDIHIRWRNMNLLDHLWSELGLDYNWSIAVHPYGKVYDKRHNALTFSTLKDLSAYQKAQIDSRKDKNRSWLSYPQSKLFASEQNTDHKVKADDWKSKAKFICESYDIAMQMPELIAITHNHFQDNIHRNNKKPTKHTMLPASVKADLSNAHRYETFQAYLSTTPKVWNKKDDHYCCKILKLGCTPH